MHRHTTEYKHNYIHSKKYIINTTNTYNNQKYTIHTGIQYKNTYTNTSAYTQNIKNIKNQTKIHTRIHRNTSNMLKI